MPSAYGNGYAYLPLTRQIRLRKWLRLFAANAANTATLGGYVLPPKAVARIRRRFSEFHTPDFAPSGQYI